MTDKYTICCPTDFNCKDGYLLGWKLSGNYICLASATSLTLLNEVNQSNPVQTPLLVLGEIKSTSANVGITNKRAFPSRIPSSLRQNDIWISIVMNSNDPRPQIFSCNDEPCLVLYYDTPNRRTHQFLSLKPLQMDLNQQDDDDSPLEESALLANNVNLACPAIDTFSQSSLPQAIDHINAVSEIDDFVQEKEPSSITVGIRLRIKSEFRRLMIFLSWIFISFFVAFRSVGEIFLLLWNIKLPAPNPIALKDLSATIHQLDVRLEQMCSWPDQYRIIRHEEVLDMPTSRAHYINLQSTLWLIANDVIVGVAIGSILCSNSDRLAIWLSAFVKNHAVDDLRETLLWLNDWPIGLKLNYDLGTFFCDSFLWFTKIWETVCISAMLPHLSIMIYVTGLCTYFGTTIFLAIASDFISIATLHLYIFYLMATFLFSFHLQIIYSLFNIFRGKRYNIKRKCAEPHDYSLEVLLGGSILFTLAAFLFPTLLAYYLAFAIGRLGVIALHASFETILVFFNHFPLFAILLRLKDPARLPGGIRFQLLPNQNIYVNNTKSSSSVASLRISNLPIKLPDIFVQHLNLLARLSSHYSPLYLVKRMITGKDVSPIPQVKLHLASVSRQRQRSFAKLKQNISSTFSLFSSSTPSTSTSTSTSTASAPASEHPKSK